MGSVQQANYVVELEEAETRKQTMHKLTNQVVSLSPKAAK